MSRASARIPISVGAAVYLGVVLTPYILVGPNDLEEFYTGITSTKLAVDAVLAGDWPFWTLELGLGVPLPLRFHFFTHPLAPLCGAFDCSMLLRMATAAQYALGVLCMGLILRRIGVERGLAICGALAFLVTSSTIELTYKNDWPMSGINEASIPILIYALMCLFAAEDWRARLFWTLLLGGTAGTLLSMGQPVMQFLVVVPFALAQPAHLWERRGWIALAAAVTVCIGAAHVYHLVEQLLLTPPVPRYSHEDAGVAAHLWSTFLRPFGPELDTTWRITFLGPPFACLALLAAVRRRPELWPFQIGLAASLLLMVLPEEVLFNVVTARWRYRAGVNIYGILLATSLLGEWARTRSRAGIALIVALQFGWQWLAFYPVWQPVAQVAAGQPEPDSTVRRLAQESSAVEQLAAVVQRRPGRILLSAETYAAIRGLSLANQGLAPNVFAMAGIPTLNALAHGVTVDPLYPTQELTSGPILPPQDAQSDQAFLDVLGIRYVVARPGEAWVPSLRDAGELPGRLRVLENSTAWPEAFFVARLPDARLPRKPGCPHDRFLCADFSRYPIERSEVPIALDRHHDGMTLTFAPAPETRNVILTHWFQPGWRVWGGTADIFQVAEQLIGLRIPAGESSVTLTFFPAVRGSLFVLGVALQFAVLIGCVWLAWWRRNQRALA